MEVCFCMNKFNSSDPVAAVLLINDEETPANNSSPNKATDSLLYCVNIADHGKPNKEVFIQIFW